MLNRHPEIAVPLESLFIIDYLRAQNSVSIELLRELAIREFELKEWGLNVNQKELRRCTDAVALIDELHRIYARQTGKTKWGQKTPRFIRYGTLIKSAWPRARFVFIVRDPRAVVSSLSRSNVHRSNALYGSKRWVRDCTAGLSLEARWPDDVLRVHYEQLVRNPETTLATICGFLGIRMDTVMLDPVYGEESSYGMYYSEIHRRLQDPPNADRIDSWQREIPDRDVAVIERICRETMIRLGYEPSRQPRECPGSYLYRLRFQRILGLVSQLTHYAATRWPYLTCTLRRKFRLGLLSDFFDVNY
jgi:hypothetical protein